MSQTATQRAQQATSTLNSNIYTTSHSRTTYRGYRPRRGRWRRDRVLEDPVSGGDDVCITWRFRGLVRHLRPGSACSDQPDMDLIATARTTSSGGCTKAKDALESGRDWCRPRRVDEKLRHRRLAPPTPHAEHVLLPRSWRLPQQCPPSVTCRGSGSARLKRSNHALQIAERRLTDVECHLTDCQFAMDDGHGRPAFHSTIYYRQSVNLRRHPQSECCESIVNRARRAESTPS